MCASNRIVFLSERSGYLWWTIVRVHYTAERIGEWAGGYDRADWFECSLLLGKPSGNSLSALLYRYWRFCVVYIDTVSINAITARYCGWLLGKLVNVVSEVPQVSVLGPLLFLLYTSELFFILENKLIGYADDSTLMAVVPSPGVRVTVSRVPDSWPWQG